MTTTSSAAPPDRTPHDAAWHAIFGELDARDPAYLKTYPIYFPPVGEAPSIMSVNGVDFPVGDWGAHAFADCRERLYAAGVEVREGDGMLWFTMMAMLTDSFKSNDMFAPAAATRAIKVPVTRRTRDGRKYRVWGDGPIPLILINARGIPLLLWSKLLCDETLPFRIYVIDDESGDILNGGIATVLNAKQAASEILEVVDDQRLADVLVVGWSNASRVALEVAVAGGGRISRLVLLTPTFSGPVDVAGQYTEFQNGQRRIFDAAVRSPERADDIADLLRKRWLAPIEWRASRLPIGVQEENFLRLPSRDVAAALVVPFSDGANLLRYAHQSKQDELHATSHVLSELANSVDIKLLLLTGAHDQFVSNAHTRAVMASARMHYAEACIFGAGHYLHDLQYGYFRKLLISFVRDEFQKLRLTRVATLMQ